MKKAFFFDMDGVLADTETEWDRLGYDDLLKKHFGEELFARVQVNSGTSIKGIFDQFVAIGWAGDYQSFHAANMQMAEEIYHSIPISPGTDELIDYLAKNNFVIGIVSSSPVEWINTLTSRLKNKTKLSLILSVNNHQTLQPKPSPDPYLYALAKAGVEPGRSIVLEDSRTGVLAAKASGATTIWYSATYHGLNWQIKPDNADYNVSSMQEVQEIVAKIGLT